MLKFLVAAASYRVVRCLQVIFSRFFEVLDVITKIGEASGKC